MGSVHKSWDLPLVLCKMAWKCSGGCVCYATVVEFFTQDYLNVSRLSLAEREKERGREALMVLGPDFMEEYMVCMSHPWNSLEHRRSSSLVKTAILAIVAEGIKGWKATRRTCVVYLSHDHMVWSPSSITMCPRLLPFTTRNYRRIVPKFESGQSIFSTVQDTF